jgi:hypothetical protein
LGKPGLLLNSGELGQKGSTENRRTSHMKTTIGLSKVMKKRIRLNKLQQQDRKKSGQHIPRLLYF